MKKGAFFIFIVLIFVSLVSADCEEGQIDVNEASIEELDQLSGIGPAKAQEIINSRPFNAIDDLINVKGIGEVTLENIKTQGLACVEDENTEASEQNSLENEGNETEKSNSVENTNLEGVENSFMEFETISLNELNPKVIKTEENKGLKENLALLGFFAFCVLLAVLFVTKGRKYKTEFK